MSDTLQTEGWGILELPHDTTFYDRASGFWMASVQTTEDVTAWPYRVAVEELSKDEGDSCLCAYFPAFGRNTLSGHGYTAKEAVERLYEGVGMIKAHFEQHGTPLPEPDVPRR